MKKPFIISVNSVSGGGKTAVSVALHKALPGSVLFSFDDFDETNVYPADYYEWSQRGGDVEEFDFPGMHEAVEAEVKKATAKQIILDFPFGRTHSRFRDLIDFAVFVDTPLDVAMARRILRDYPCEGNNSAQETLQELRDDMSSYLARARFPYLDTYRDRAKSDLVLDGWRSLDDITGEIVAVLKSRKAPRQMTRRLTDGGQG